MSFKPEGDVCAVPLRIVVIGAGIAGLSTAISLGGRGHSIVVLESTNELQSLGAGVVLAPPAKHWYEAERVLSANDPACSAAEGFESRSWDTGEVVAQTAFPPEKSAFPILHGDLKSALVLRAETLDNVEIKFDSHVSDVDTDRSEVILAAGERIGGDLIIIADGVGSKLKWKVTSSKDERAQPTGDAAYRLVFSRELLEKDEELLLLMDSPWIKRWDGPRGHSVAYAVRNRELLNVVLIHPDEHAEESWTFMSEKEHVLADFDGWNLTLQKLIGLAPEKVPNFRILAHSPSPAWVKGAVILLGDACHAMPPYVGQGVAQAVEDATAITTVLSLIQTREQLPAALEAYETSRKGRVLEMQAATAQARKFAYQKEREAKTIHDDKKEAKRSEDALKIIRSTWNWDAAEAARTALSQILDAA